MSISSKPANYHVTVTEDSADALSLARHERYDLILVDNWMPGLSGQELTREIRTFNKSTPIQLLAESRKQKATRLLRQMPTLGPIWTALIIAAVDTPHRFRTKRQFWAYCGLAVVTGSSADYWFDKKGELRKSRRPAATRGWNRNYNRRLKKIFKSAALVGIVKGPFQPYYQRLLAQGLRPELARLTLARKIAAITLAVWKKGERFDPEKLTTLTT